MSFTGPFLFGLVFFRTALPCYGGAAGGGISFHGAVGRNYNNGATTENQGAGLKYLG